MVYDVVQYHLKLIQCTQKINPKYISIFKKQKKKNILITNYKKLILPLKMISVVKKNK